MSDWQPIETAPRDGTRILLANISDIDIGWWDYSCYTGHAWIVNYARSDTETIEPTHWMPLPLLPVALPEVLTH